MKDVLLTSSVLIGALLILRLLFRRVIARRAQYALWLLVAVRLLVPVSLPAADFSVLTAAEPVSRQITAPSLYMEPVQEDVRVRQISRLWTKRSQTTVRWPSAAPRRIIHGYSLTRKT